MLLPRLRISFPLSRRFFGSNSGPELARTIAELNQEMASVFGEPPSSLQDDLLCNHSTSQEIQSVSAKISDNVLGLTHTNIKGQAQMVDVSPKRTTNRAAIASCKVLLGKEVFDLVSANQMAKGDVLSIAKIAGITGAKQTSTLIPLCHNISLTHVRVDLTLNAEDYSVEVEGEANATGKTGVEMEAMMAVTVAGLTVYDMCKAASKEIEITNIRLKSKFGGKSGHWAREN